MNRRGTVVSVSPTDPCAFGDTSARAGCPVASDWSARRARARRVRPAPGLDEGRQVGRESGRLAYAAGHSSGDLRLRSELAVDRLPFGPRVEVHGAVAVWPGRLRDRRDRA